MMITTLFRRMFALLTAVLLGGGAAYAAAVPSGATLMAWAAGSRGNAIAYDSLNHVYLVVSTYGVLRGRFVSSTGTPMGSPFVIQSSGNFTHFPGVAFSADADGGAGGFLVSWHESDLPLGNTSIHARMVSFGKNGPYGADNQVSTDGSWWESHISVAYSTGSKEFLVVYPRSHGLGYGIRAVRLDNNAAPRDVVFTIAKSNQFEDNPGVAYDPVTNQFLVSYSGYDPIANFAFVNARLVQSGVNQILGAGPTQLTATLGTWITEVVYNPVTNQYLVAWYASSRGLTADYGRLLNADGSIASNVMLLSTRWKANDGLGVAYNKLSNTYFLVASTPLAYDDGGVELVGSTGMPVDNGFLVTNSGSTGNFYPRIAAGTDDPNWVMSTAHSFTSTMVQLITGTASGPVSSSLLSVDAPSPNSTVAASFTIDGWALDKGAASGTGIDAVMAWAYPSGGGGAIVAGVATLGISRPDVGALFGSQFTPSGYSIPVTTLPGGSYTIAVYSHSTVANSWSAAPVVFKLTVSNSRPLMWVDTPSANQTVGQAFVIGGWALDLGATSGTGVDTVHVWAYPWSGGSAMFVGASSEGVSRGDVGAIFGSQFTPSGFSVAGTLPPGTYTLAVFAHSTVTGTFNNMVVRTITVQ